MSINTVNHFMSKKKKKSANIRIEGIIGKIYLNYKNEIDSLKL